MSNIQANSSANHLRLTRLSFAAYATKPARSGQIRVDKALGDRRCEDRENSENENHLGKRKQK